MAAKIPDWAVKAKEGCGCKDYECKMNAWGVEECEARMNLIVAHLVGQSDMLIPMFKALPTAARRIMAKALVVSAINEEKAKNA